MKDQQTTDCVSMDNESCALIVNVYAEVLECRHPPTSSPTNFAQPYVDF
jgi:hypothetical protein